MPLPVPSEPLSVEEKPTDCILRRNVMRWNVVCRPLLSLASRADSSQIRAPTLGIAELSDVSRTLI